MRGPPGPALPAGPTARTFSLWLAKSSTFLNRKLHSLGWGRKASPVRATGGRNGSGADRAHLHSMARRAQAAGTAPAATCGRYAAGAELGTVGPRGRREECWRRRIPPPHYVPRLLCQASTSWSQRRGWSRRAGRETPPRRARHFCLQASARFHARAPSMRQAEQELVGVAQRAAGGDGGGSGGAATLGGGRAMAQLAQSWACGRAHEAAKWREGGRAPAFAGRAPRVARVPGAGIGGGAVGIA